MEIFTTTALILSILIYHFTDSYHRTYRSALHKMILPSRPEPEFEELPAEVRLIIMRHIDDLATLGSLLHASPTTFRVFQDNSADVVNSVLRPGEGSELNDLARIAIGIRLSETDCETLSDFNVKYIRKIGKTNAQIWQGSGLQALFGPLQKDLPADTYREFAGTAYEIWVHTQACLKHYLDRFMELTPCHMFDGKFKYGVGAKRAWHERPQGYECFTYHAGRPSPAEEHEVTRAFWRFQIEYELQNAVSEGRLPWPEADAQRLFPVQPGWLWDDENDQFTSIMGTVSDYLKATEKRHGLSPVRPDSGRHRQFPPPLYDTPIEWPAEEEINAQEPNLERLCDNHKLERHPHPGVSFWNVLSSDRRCPLWGIPFEPFRQFGFAIWDLQRFCLMGLLTPSETLWTRPGSRHGMYFAWHSLLTEEQLTENDRAADDSQDTIDQTSLALGFYRQSLH